MHLVIICHDLVKNANIEVLSVFVVVDRSRGSMGDIDDMGVFHTHPSGQHSSVATTENDNGAIRAVGLFEEINELYVVH